MRDRNFPQPEGKFRYKCATRGGRLQVEDLFKAAAGAEFDTARHRAAATGLVPWIQHLLELRPGSAGGRRRDFGPLEIGSNFASCKCTISAFEPAQFILGDANHGVYLSPRKGLPKHGRIEIAILVAQNITDGTDRRPWDRRMSALDVRFEHHDVPYGFRYTEHAKIDEIVEVGRR